MTTQKPAALILCGLLLAFAEIIQAQLAPFTVKEVGPNVWAVIADVTGPAGGNTGFVIGDDGVLVIDTFVSTDAATQLLAKIRKQTNLPIKYVVNTHYHFDHVGGNQVFVNEGAVVLAQRNVRSWIHSENLRLAGPDVKPDLKAAIEAVTAPTVLYDQTLDLYLGSRKIEVRSFPGHTGGDSVVVIPDAKVAFGGDLFWREILPNLIDATTKTWVETLDTLTKTMPGYTFVPGHGDVGRLQDVTAFRDYLAALRQQVSDARAQGKSGDALADAVMSSLTPKYGRWDAYSYLAKPNIVDVDAELSGKKRIPQAESK